MKKLFFLLIVLFSFSCRNVELENMPTNGGSDEVHKDALLLSDYAKSIFEENYKDVDLYQVLKMIPEWGNYKIVQHDKENLVLCVPISVDYITDRKYCLFVRQTGNTVRSCIMGTPDISSDSIMELREEMDGGMLPEFTVVADYCARMNHICSDPFDPMFLDYLREYFLRQAIEEARAEAEWNRRNRENATEAESNDKYPWDRLNKEEKAFVKAHPIAAKKFFENAKKALKFVEKMDGLHNGVGDAMRHAYWSALNVKSEGFDLAKQYGDAHEKTPGQPYAEMEMDHFNNGVGYQIGLDAIKNGWSELRIMQEVRNAAKDGLLQTEIKTRGCDDEEDYEDKEIDH